MSRIAALKRRYSASASLVQHGVEIVAFGDPEGARFNAAVRQLIALTKDEGAPHLENLVGAAKILRWRRITQPQPILYNPGLTELASEVKKQTRRLRGALQDEALLDELSCSANALTGTDSTVGSILLKSIEEVGADTCVVVAANGSAAAGLKSWLLEHGVLVLTAGDLQRNQPEREQTYVVGPPRFYRSSLVTAPITEEVSFLLPAWFGDRSVPQSVIASYAEGAVRIKARVFVEGVSGESLSGLPDEPADEDSYLPQPVWRHPDDDGREPTSEEVAARKLLLSGGLAMWLDDGERIRALDPSQPLGERVTYTDVSAVRPGTYLLLRRGETERTALYQAAIARLANGNDINSTQTAWKHSLMERLQKVGYRQAIRRLRDAGVKSADRAPAWTDANLIRPSRDKDFEILLRWLGVSIQPTFEYATLLRRTLYQVSAQIRKQLEAAVSTADLTKLELKGHLSLEVPVDGFRGILATRVLAISPFNKIVSRYDARVPFEDRSGQWLE